MPFPRASEALSRFTVLGLRRVSAPGHLGRQLEDLGTNDRRLGGGLPLNSRKLPSFIFEAHISVDKILGSILSGFHGGN